jgi:hypothetical protein
MGRQSGRRLGTVQITEGTVSGNSVTFKIAVDIPGQGSLVVTFTGTVRGNNISGTADVGPMGKMDFTGSKSPGGF